MKKIIFTILTFILPFLSVEAFQIDIDKIEINNKSKELTENLNNSYKIDIENFDNTIINDESVYDLIHELTRISLDNTSQQSKKENLLEYLYISKTNGFDTLTGSMAIDLYLDKLEKNEIKSEYIKDSKTATLENEDIMSFVYLDDCKTNEGKKDVILAYWLKKEEDTYHLYYPWITIEDDLEEYYQAIISKEDNGERIGGSYNKLSLSDEKQTVSDDLLNKIYNDNKDSVVQITGMDKNGLGAYGSGFFISEGVVVTTWNLFKSLLVNSNYIYANDSEGNTYDILGVVAANTTYDVVVLKIDKNAGKPVTFGNSENLNSNDNLFKINSKVNSGFSISYGTYLSQNNGRLKNLFLASSSDNGAALFNKSGEAIGIQSGDLLNSELSYANSTNYLINLQKIVRNQSYNKIQYTEYEEFKENYYSDVNEESTYIKVDNKILENFRSIGSLDKTIILPLLKASYQDKILSLRYKNNRESSIDSIYLISNYIEELIKSGYKLTYEDKYKKIYKNNQYKIIIKDNLNYLIILIMEDNIWKK